MQEARVQFLGWEDPLEKEMAIHSSTLAWKIPWTEEPGRLQSMGSQSRTRLSDFTFTFINQRTCLPVQKTQETLVFYPWVREIPWRRKWQPTPVSLPEKSHGQRSLVGYTVHGDAKSWTQLSY